MFWDCGGEDPLLEECFLEGTGVLAGNFETVFGETELGGEVPVWIPLVWVDVSVAEFLEDFQFGSDFWGEDEPGREEALPPERVKDRRVD